jgi:restriction system protein
MTRRRRHIPTPDDVLFGLMGMAVFAVFAVLGSIQRQSLDMGGVLVNLLVSAVVVATIYHLYRVSVRLYRVFSRAKARRSLTQLAKTVVERHMTSLLKRRAQLVRYDAYSKLQLEGWRKEIAYFIDSQIAPHLTDRERTILEDERESLSLLIGRRVEDASKTATTFQGFSDRMTATEFEAFCADELRRAGWQAQVTKRARDQGVDVIAEKNDVRVVLQCKLWNQPVGNKAVQEAVAGKGYEKAQHAAVVTNSRYTTAAQQLASMNGVLLLHYSDLAELDTRLIK